MGKNAFFLSFLLIMLCLYRLPAAHCDELDEEPSEDGHGIVVGRHFQGIYEDKEKIVEEKLKETPVAPWEYDDVLRTQIALSSAAPRIEEMYRLAINPGLSNEQKITEITKWLEALRTPAPPEKQQKDTPPSPAQPQTQQKSNPPPPARR